MKHLLFIALSFSFLQTYSQTRTSTDSTVKELQEVVVTGQYSPQSVKQTVYKVRTISSERIKLRAATTIVEALNMEAGIRFSTDYTLAETDINILGMSGQNVKVLVDGVPMVDRGSAKQSLSQIDINNVERIEIVEGPMSVVYGTDALAGVINIITKKNKTTATRQFNLTARLLEETTGNTYEPFQGNGIHNAYVGANWQKNNWRVGGSLSRNSFGGWTGDAAFPAQEAKPKDQYLAMGTMGYQTKKSDIWYRLDYLNEDIYVAGVLNTNNYRAKDQHYYTNRFTHQLQNEWRIREALKLNTSASYQHYQRNTETHIIDYTNGSATPSAGEGEWDRSVFKTIFLRSTLLWKLNKKTAIQPGIEIKSDQTSGQRILGEPDIVDYSFFLSGEFKPNRVLSFRPGLRVSKNSVYEAPPLIPSLNIKLALGKETDLRVSYARGFRAPILRELYFYYFDANHSIKGNPDLKAETSNSYTASLSFNERGHKVRWKTSLSGFYNQFNNRIAMAAAPNNEFTYINIESFKTIGGGWEQQIRSDRWNTTIGVMYVGRYNRYAADPDFTKEALPEFVWSPELSVNMLYRLPKPNITLGLFYKFTGALPNYQTRLNTNTNLTEVYLSKIASYHWADLTVSKMVGSRLTVQAGAKNIFNITRLQNTTSSAGVAHNSGGPVLTGFGRSFFAGITYSISNNQ